MALLDFVKSKFIKQKVKSGRNILDSRYFSQGTSFNLNNSQDFIEAYHTISYIGYAADKRAGSLAKTAWEIVDKNNEPIEGLKVNALLARPELQTSCYQWLKSIGQHKFLDGNAFIVKGIDNAFGALNGLPTALMVINPANVDVIDETGSRVLSTSNQAGRRIVSYIVSIRGNQYEIAPDKMIHINNGNAINMLRGMGEIQKNVGLLESDKLQNMFNKAFFEGGAVANLMLEQLPDAQLMEQDYLKAVTDFRATYGIQKQPIMVAPQGFVAKPIDISYKNIEFSVLKSMTKEDIMMFAGIPRSMYGSQNQYVTKLEDQIAWEAVLEDDYVVVEQEITEFVREYENREDITFQFKRAKTVNIDNALKLVNSGIMNGYVTPEQAREITGLPDDENASEEFFMPSNLFPIGGDSIQTYSEEDGSKSVKTRRQNIVRKSMKIKEKLEQKALPFVKEYYRGLTERIISTKSIVDDFNWNAEEQELIKSAKRMYTSLLAVGIKETNELYRANARTDYGSIGLKVERLANRYVKEVLNVRRKELKELVSEAMQNGYAQEGIRSEIKKTFHDDFLGQESWKATRIARTEASNAYDQASLASLDDLGVKFVDVVGCEDDHIMPGETYGCNSTHIPIEESYGINFHPNHTGVIVPSEGG